MITPLISQAAAADALGVSEKTVFNLRKKGLLRSTGGRKSGSRKIMIPVEDVQNLINLWINQNLNSNKTSETFSSPSFMKVDRDTEFRFGREIAKRHKLGLKR